MVSHLLVIESGSPIQFLCIAAVLLIIILGFLFFFGGNKKDHSSYVCSQCGSTTAERHTKGHFIIEVILYLFFCLPGVIYSLWRVFSRRWVCSQCKSDKLLPQGSVIGQKTYQSRSNHNPDDTIANCQVSRNGAILGTHTEAQLYQYLNSGHYLPSDYYWKPGMTEWLPLTSLSSQTQVPLPPSPNQIRTGVIIKGSIINFNIQSGSGIISGENGIRYNFISADWGSPNMLPTIGLNVEFIANGQNARDIYPTSNNNQQGNASSTDYYRSSDNAMIFGVCAGLAHKFKTDTFLVRLLIFFIPLGWLLYIFGISWPSRPTR